VIQAGNNQQQERTAHKYRHDDFLRRFSFGRRADLHAAFDQLGIVLEEIDAERSRRCDEDEVPEPGLPEMQRAGRREQQHGEQRYKQQRAAPRLTVEIGHACAPFASAGASTAMLTYCAERLIWSPTVRYKLAVQLAVNADFTLFRDLNRRRRGCLRHVGAP
jgi:hypothetical protein